MAVETLELAHEGLWQLSILKIGAQAAGGEHLMDVHIDELHTTVDTVRPDALLSPEVLAAIVAAVRGQRWRGRGGRPATAPRTSTRGRSSTSNAPGGGERVPSLLKAKFKVYKKDGSFETVDVQYNPSTLSFEKSPKVAEIADPRSGRAVAPVRPRPERDADRRRCSSTRPRPAPARAPAASPSITDKFYGLVKIDPKTHAPPVCTFIWGSQLPRRQPAADVPEPAAYRVQGPGHQGQAGLRALQPAGHAAARHADA